MSLSATPRRVRDAVFSRDQGRCRYCQLHQIGQSSVFHINHILPRSRDGSTTLENLVLQCPSCSLHKSNKVEGVDPVTRVSCPLFNPLTQTWAEHFTMRDDGTCEGKSAIGRVTVEGLRMNDSLARMARSIQRMLGLNE